MTSTASRPRLRIFTVIPIAIVAASIGGYTASWANGTGNTTTIAVGGTGLLFLPPLLMIVFRQKYPRWWFDWNLQLLRFANRLGVYLALMDDRYPSTDEEQAVHLEFPYPDARDGLNRWLPIVKWLLAIPHYIVLFFLFIGVFFAAIVAWFAILITGRYPRGSLRLHRGRDPLARPRRRVRADPCHRRLPAVPAECLRGELGEDDIRRRDPMRGRRPPIRKEVLVRHRNRDVDARTLLTACERQRVGAEQDDAGLDEHRGETEPFLPVADVVGGARQADRAAEDEADQRQPVPARRRRST